MNQKYYPIRLFNKFFFFIFSTFAVAVSLFFYTLISAYRIPVSFQEFLIIVLFLLLVLSVCSLWLAYRFSKPIQKIILKALRMSSKKGLSMTGFSDEDLLEEEMGEYSELESALEKIKRKMKKRRDQLAIERQESRAMMSSLEDAIVSISADEKIVFYNSQFAIRFMDQDVSKLETIQLQRVFRDPTVNDLFHQSLQGQVVKKQVQLLQNHEVLPHYFSINMVPLREEKQDKIYGVLALFHDISEMKKAEKMRLEFVENASHELRTPITSIKGYAATLSDDLKAKNYEQAEHFLAIIQKNTNRLAELVNDMLTLSSLESFSNIQKETFSPDQLTHDVFTKLAAMASEKRIMLKTSCYVKAINADLTNVDQVLTNLVGNAIKYTQPEGVVEVEWRHDETGKVQLSVKDNGPGISKEFQSRLFERFYRVDKSRSRDVGGTGLGLAIVKHIMQNHGGSVRIQSESGAGAEFICLFP